jgi:hypothetical protein
VNNYTITIQDAHSHSFTLTVPAQGNADALNRGISDALNAQAIAALLVATDTWTITVVIA